MEQLATLFGLILQTDAELNDKRFQLQLDGQRLFEDMDRYNQGFISSGQFGNWVADNCGFHIADEDLPALEASLDGSADYRITKEGFIENVSMPEEEESAQNANEPSPQQVQAQAQAQVQQKKAKKGK